MASTNPVAPKNGDRESEEQRATDIAAFVQDLLVEMQSRFQTMSKGIVEKIDEMGSKIDELEKNINRFKSEIDAESTVMSNTEEGKSSDDSS